MRLGGFYGFTAPMLLLVYNNEVENIVQSFNVSLNSNTALELKKELWHLKKALDYIKFDIAVANDKLLEYAQVARIENGKIVGQAVDESLESEIVYCLVDHCAAKLLEKLYDSKTHLDIASLENQETFLLNMKNYVLEALQGKSFSLDNVASLVRAFLKLLNNEAKGDSSQVIRNIKTFCAIEENLPSTFYVNETTIELSEDEHAVLSYFIKHRDDIVTIQRAIKETDVADENIFKISFMDFLNRKPSSLYHMVVNQFDYLKNADIRLLPGVLKNVTEEFNKCKLLIKERLLIEEQEVNTIDSSQLETYFTDAETVAFLQSLFDKLHLSEIAEADLNNLQTLYFAAECLTLSYLNEVWGTHFTLDTFNTMVEKMNKLHIGGINLFTPHLFQASLQEIIFTSGGQIRKSEEYLAELKQVCFDIDALLSTFKPIGGDLGV